MKAICNSSVLIALSSIGQLNLLRRWCRDEKLIIPQAVWTEVVEEGVGRPGAQEVRSVDWIKVESVRAQSMVELLHTRLDRGEAEVIAMALERGVNLVFLDEKDAREAAEELGLKVLGTIGILIWAKREGHIESLRQQLDDLQAKAKFRISEELYRRVLGEVGEFEMH